MRLRIRRARRLLLEGQVAQERDGLQRLAEAHFVGEDGVQVALVQREQPVEALELVVAHRAARDARRLALKPNHLLIQLSLLLGILVIGVALGLVARTTLAATRGSTLRAFTASVHTA